MSSKRIKDLKLAEAIFQALDTNKNGELIIPEYLRVWGSGRDRNKYDVNQ